MKVEQTSEEGGLDREVRWMDDDLSLFVVMCRAAYILPQLTGHSDV